MNTKQILQTIQNKDFTSFTLVWNEHKQSMSEHDKQHLLTEIVGYYYSDADFSFFVSVFNTILKSKVSLNFCIDHWAPSFLSLVVNNASIQLFDYFIKKGADINFIADEYAFESEETIQRETGEIGNARYSTCLDFAELTLADLLTIDYNYYVPKTTEQLQTWQEVDDAEQITISKRGHLYLLEQSHYLHDLIHTHRLVNHIKSLGGKTYKELNASKSSKNE